MTDTMTEIGSQEGKTSYGPKELASFLKQLNGEDKNTFIRAMQEEGEELGFQDARMIWLSFGHVQPILCTYTTGRSR
jgi:hypothetical protein